MFVKPEATLFKCVTPGAQCVMSLTFEVKSPANCPVCSLLRHVRYRAFGKHPVTSSSVNELLDQSVESREFESGFKTTPPPLHHRLAGICWVGSFVTWMLNNDPSLSFSLEPKTVVNRKITQCKSLSEERNVFTLFLLKKLLKTLFNIEQNHTDDLCIPRKVLLMKNKVSLFCSYIWLSFELS